MSDSKTLMTYRKKICRNFLETFLKTNNKKQSQRHRGLKLTDSAATHGLVLFFFIDRFRKAVLWEKNGPSLRLASTRRFLPRRF